METVTAEAAKADKNGDASKDTKSKSKCTTHKGRGGQKSSLSKKVNLAEDNLDEFFGLSQKKNTQETLDVTHDEPQKKSEGVELQDKPKNSTQKDICKLPLGSGGEGLPKPSSKSKKSARPVKKPESKDSSLLSNSDSEHASSDDEEDNHNKQMELPPPSRKTWES